MKLQLKKVSYTAPKMEATSFKVEQGYATSGIPQPTVGATLNVGSDSL